MDVQLASCAELPEPDHDERPLVDGLRRAGISCAVRPWDGAGEVWDRAALTILRSTWNYPHAPDRFLAWAQQAAAVSELWNPLPAVRWNLHKSYLLELERWGLRTVPTELVAAGSGELLTAVLERRRWRVAVVKPAVSAASYRTLLVEASAIEAGEMHLRDLVRAGDVLVQAFVPTVATYGERALVWIDGELTHAVRKRPRFEGDDESVDPRPVAIAAAERELAQRAIDAVRAHLNVELLYARIDLAPLETDGCEPAVMELELIEPSLFFPQSPPALDRFVAGVKRRLTAAAVRRLSRPSPS